MRLSARMDAAAVTATLDAAGEMLESGDLIPMWEALSLGAQRVMQQQFHDQGRSRGEEWPRPVWWGIVIRAKGKKQKKIRTFEEIKQIKADAVMDTGAALNSVIFAMAPNSISLGNDFGQAGSSLKYLEKFQTGGSSVFQFTPQMEKNLEKNVYKTLPGGKPKTTPTGRKSRAKKNWNPDYFIMRNYLRKKSGKQVSVRKRRIIPADYGGPADKAFFSTIISRTIAAILAGRKDPGGSE